MNGQIFVSYRREDSAGTTGRLFDRLAKRFPRSRIFMDVDSIEPGEDFLKNIEQAVASCDVLIAVIGTRWLLSSDREGKSGLDNPEDFVRLETHRPGALVKEWASLFFAPRGVCFQPIALGPYQRSLR